MEDFARTCKTSRRDPAILPAKSLMRRMRLPAWLTLPKDCCRRDSSEPGREGYSSESAPGREKRRLSGCQALLRGLSRPCDHREETCSKPRTDLQDVGTEPGPSSDPSEPPPEISRRILRWVSLNPFGIGLPCSEPSPGPLATTALTSSSKGRPRPLRAAPR